MSRRDQSPKALAAALAVCMIASIALMTGTSSAQRPLGERIQEKRSQVDRAKSREGVLTREIDRYGQRVSRLRGEVAGLKTRESRVQEQLSARQRELDGARSDLRQERSRLERLRTRLRRSIRVLEERLVEMYKAGAPDALTVILDSDGFSDFVQRAEFMRRIGDQDSAVVGRYRELRNESRRAVGRLRDLERRIRAARDEIAAKRRELARTRSTLERRQSSLRGAIGERRDALGSIRSERRKYEGELVILEEEERQIQARLRAARSPETGGGGGSAPQSQQPAGPVRRGGSGMIWPVNGPVTSPFGPRWGRMHNGIDIGAPAGTPIRAAQAGTVAIAAPTGGYGNFVCINHSGGLSTCYAHLSSYGTSVGARVGQGDVIGAVGCTGHCFGDHLHFEVRVNGSATNPMGYL